MASGRKNRGSRHRSHRHKQQKGDDSGDSDAEQNLRHGPNPNPNPSSSSPWAMEPLPPNVEGPSALKQPDTDNVVRDSQQTTFGRRRKEHISVVGDAASMMDRWDGGGGADDAATLALYDVTERSSNILGEGVVSWREARSESEPRNSKGKGKSMSAVASTKGLEQVGSNALVSSAQVSTGTYIQRDLKSEGYLESNSDFVGSHLSDFDASDPTKGRISKSVLNEKEFEDASISATMSMDMDRKRTRRSESSQKSKKLEGIGDNESSDEHHGSAEKGITGLHQDDFRNIELEKELESRIRRRTEGSGDREKWRDGGSERDFKGSRFHNEERFQVEGRLKDEKPRQEKLKDDAVLKSRRERSSSRHRDDTWKPCRHMEDKSKEESITVSGDREGWAKYEKDYELKRKLDKARVDRSLESKMKDEKQEEVLSSKDETRNFKSKDISKELKEKEGRPTEGKHKESRPKDTKHNDEKDRDGRSKTEGSASEDRRLTSESVKKDNQQRQQRHAVESHSQEECKREFELPKEEKSKVKGKLEENVKDEREKLEKHRNEGPAHAKYKNDKRRIETEDIDVARYRDDSGVDVVATRKRTDRDQDFNARYNKRLSDEGGFVRRQDDKDTYEKQKIDTQSQRENQKANGKQLESLLKHEKMYDLNDKDRDAWASGREKVKDDLSRQHSKHRDESQERRWGGAFQDEMFKQKHSRDVEERPRFTLFNVGKQRGDRGKDDRKQIDKLKDERYDDAPIPVFERLGGAKEINRRSDGGDKDSRRMSLDKVYDQFGTKGKDLDGHLKLKGPRDPVDTRESKVHGTNKSDRAAAKTSRSASSQDQDRVQSTSGTKDASASENLSKRIVESDMFEAVNAADRDIARPRGRQAEEKLHGDRTLHEKVGRKNKFEVSVGSGSRRPRDQNWHMINHQDQGKGFLGPDEEVRSWEPKVSNQDSDDEKRWPYSHERIRDAYSPKGLGRGHDDFGRASDSLLSKDSSMSKRKHESFTQNAAGQGKHRRLDDTGAERLEWSYQSSQGNRAPLDGPMGRSLPPNRHLGSSALLPPPPPYRPGVDNPTVMGAPSNFVEGSNARDVGRYDRKAGGGHSRRSEIVGPSDTWGAFGMGSWNAHNQGPVPGPGGMFPSFPQMPPGFLGMGQQFHIPQVFGPNGSRPVNMGFGGRFRMGDGGAGFPGHASDHGPAMGWHRFSDGSEGHRPLSGFIPAWEGSVRYTDERQRFSHHPDWDQFSQGIPGGWDIVSEPWQAQVGDDGFDLNATHRQREALHQARVRDIPWREPETEKLEGMEHGTLDTTETSHISTNNVPEKFTPKATRQFKQRLQKLLLHANVQANLVDAELYKEYLGWLPPSKDEERKMGGEAHMDDSTLFIDQDLKFEADMELEKISSTATCPRILPALPQNAFEDALKVFQRSQDRIQKSKFGSFVLPISISGRVRSGCSTGSPKVDSAVYVQDMQSTSPGSGNRGLSETLVSKEALDAKCYEDGISSAVESFTDESDSAKVVADGIESDIAGVAVEPDNTGLPLHGGNDPVPQNVGDDDIEQRSLTKAERRMSTESSLASEVADSSDWMDQNGVILDNHVETPELVEREQSTCQDVDGTTFAVEALTFSAKENELVESFEISGAIIIDAKKDKHRQEVYLDSALGNLP